MTCLFPACLANKVLFEHGYACFCSRHSCFLYCNRVEWLRPKTSQPAEGKPFTTLVGNVTDFWSVTQSKRYYLLSSWFSESQFPSNPQHRLPSWEWCEMPQDLVSNTGFFGVCQLAHGRQVMGGLSVHGNFLAVHVTANLSLVFLHTGGFPRDKKKKHPLHVHIRVSAAWISAWTLSQGFSKSKPKTTQMRVKTSHRYF